MTVAQIAAIISLLYAFNVDPSVVEQVRQEITPHTVASATSTPPTSPQIIIYVPAPQSSQTPTFGNVTQTPACVDSPTLGPISTSTTFNTNTEWQAKFSDTCPIDSSTPIGLGIETSDGTILQSGTTTIGKAMGINAPTYKSNDPTVISLYGPAGQTLVGPFNLPNYWNRVSSTTPLYAFISIDGITQTAQVQ